MDCSKVWRDCSKVAMDCSNLAGDCSNLCFDCRKFFSSDRCLGLIVILIYQKRLLILNILILLRYTKD